MIQIVRQIQHFLYFLIPFVFTPACSGIHLDTGSPVGARQQGFATYYADSLHGNRTASGERYDKHQLTAAHRTLPFGSVVRVVNVRNRRSVYVKINDRGPFGNSERIVDLSRRAAEVIDMIEDGVVPVELELVELPQAK